MTKAVELAQVASTGVSEAFKNRIINGAMVVNQYSTTGTAVTFTNANGYTLDRWNQTNTGSGTLTGTQSSVVPNTTYTYSYLATVSTGSSPASGTVVRLVQGIEGYNMADWAWGTADAKSVTLSFWVRSSLTGTFGGCLQVGTSSGNYVFQYTISAANTWQQVQIAIPANTAYTTNTTNSSGAQLYFDLGSGSDFQGTANTWTSAINKWRASGNVQLSATTGATWYMTGVQLEVGSSATSFEYRPYGTELQLCQRYFQSAGVGSSGRATSTSVIESGVQFRVPMRATPTMAWQGFANSNSVLTTTIDGLGIGSATITGATFGLTSLVGVYVVYSGSFSNGGGYWVLRGDTVSANAEL